MPSDVVAIINKAVTREVRAALVPLENRKDDIIAELDRDHKVTELQANVSRPNLLLSKKQDLEGRYRWNSVCLIAALEGSDGRRPTKFVAQLLQDLLGVDGDLPWTGLIIP